MFEWLLCLAMRLFMMMMMVLLLSCSVEETPAPDHPKNLPVVVSTAPSLTEIVAELGAIKQLAGVTDYCTYPPEVKDLPSVGGLLNPNLEVLVQLQPDIVLALPSSATNIADHISGRVVTVQNETIADILNSITQIGEAIGRPQAGRLLRQKLTHVIPATGQTKLTFALVIARDPGTLNNIYVAGPRTYLSEMAGFAGMQNIFADISQHYAPVGLEAIVARQPDIVIETVYAEGDSLILLQPATAWQKALHPNAKTQKRVWQLQASFVHQPGVRSFQLIPAFQRIAANYD
jgi:iron complex transport system substrate-binding protein